MVEGLIYPEGKFPNGVGIVYYEPDDGTFRCVSLSIWSGRRAEAIGVMVSEGDKRIIVSLQEGRGKWASETGVCGGTSASSLRLAMDDFNGENNTKEEAKDPRCNTTEYAPGFCNLYSKTDSKGRGIKAGQWWLPSYGELWMIFSNFEKINEALSLIEGATLLSSGMYWSSTEYGADYAWPCFIDRLPNSWYGTSCYSKTVKGIIRPVAAVNK